MVRVWSMHQHLDPQNQSDKSSRQHTPNAHTPLPYSSQAHHILSLQRTVGNQKVLRLLGKSPTSLQRTIWRYNGKQWLNAENDLPQSPTNPMQNKSGLGSGSLFKTLTAGDLYDDQAQYFTSSGNNTVKEGEGVNDFPKAEATVRQCLA